MQARLPMKSIYESTSIADVIGFLKESANLSNARLAEQMGLSKATVQRLGTMHKAEDHRPEPEMLDKLAAYSGVPREWLYEMAYKIETRRQYSKTISAIAELLEQAPADLQQMFLAQVRAALDARKKLGQ